MKPFNPNSLLPVLCFALGIGAFCTGAGAQTGLVEDGESFVQQAGEPGEPGQSGEDPAAPTPETSLIDLEQRLKDTEAEETRLRLEAEERSEEIRALRYRVIETANAIQESERETARIERELERLGAEEAELAEQLSAEEGNLSEVLAALQAFELSRPPALLVSPEDANRAARAASLLSDAAPALAEKANRLRALVEQLTLARTGLSDQRANYERTANALVARRRVLNELLARKETERDVAARLAAAAQKETARLAAQATSLKGVVDRLQRLAHAVTPRIKPVRGAPSVPTPAGPAGPAGSGGDDVVAGVDPSGPAGEGQPGIAIIDGSAVVSGTDLTAETNAPRTSVAPTAPGEAFRPARSFTSARGALRPPVVGRIVGRYGQPGEDGDRLEGIRIESRSQAIVTAPYEARVVFAQPYGPINMIVLDVGGGFHILLIGIGEFLVDAGQIVNAGEPLAEMTEKARFLDLQVRKNGEPVNPSQWLSAKTVEEMAF